MRISLCLLLAVLGAWKCGAVTPTPEIMSGSGDTLSPVLPLMPFSETDTTVFIPLVPTSIPPSSSSPQVLISVPTMTLSGTAIVSTTLTQPTGGISPSSTSSVSPPVSRTTTAISAPVSTTMGTTTDLEGVSLPLIVGATVGGTMVALVIVAFIVVCCCVVGVKRKKKYTLETADGGFVKTNTFPVQMMSKQNDDSAIPFSETTAATFGIEFPETPKPKDGEELPPLVILNPVQPGAFSSNTLPSKSKNKISSSKLIADDNTGVKPSRSYDDINFTNSATPTTFKSQKVSETVEKQTTTKTSPQHTQTTAQTSGDNQESSNPRESSGYVFMEPPPATLDQPRANPKTESIYQVPRGTPLHDSAVVSPNKQIVEAVYDLPPLTSAVASVQEQSKHPDVPSHYDVPKSILESIRKRAAKELEAVKSLEEEKITGTDSSVYDVPRPLLVNTTTVKGTQNDTPGGTYDTPKTPTKTRDKSPDASQKRMVSLQKQDSNSDDEHAYCLPPDSTLQMMKELAEGKEKPRESSPATKPKVRPKPKKNNSTPPPSNSTHQNETNSQKSNSPGLEQPSSNGSDNTASEVKVSPKPVAKPRAKPRVNKPQAIMPKSIMEELYSKQNAKNETSGAEQSSKEPEKPPTRPEKPEKPPVKPEKPIKPEKPSAKPEKPPVKPEKPPVKEKPKTPTMKPKLEFSETQ